MKQLKCLDIMQLCSNKKCYILTDKSGNKVHMSADELRTSMSTGKIEVTNLKLSKNNRILKNDPWLDSKGICKVNMRLKASNLGIDSKVVAVGNEYNRYGIRIKVNDKKISNNGYFVMGANGLYMDTGYIDILPIDKSINIYEELITYKKYEKFNLCVIQSTKMQDGIRETLHTIIEAKLKHLFNSSDTPEHLAKAIITLAKGQ